MAFIPFSNDKKAEIAITVDKQGRLCLSVGLRRKLGCEHEEVELILFFEEETRRIGIAKEFPGKHKPFKFDKDRGYTDAKKFLEANDIVYSEGAVRYFYEGNFGGVMAFKASGEYSDQYRQQFRQERNGNLEAIR